MFWEERRNMSNELESHIFVTLENPLKEKGYELVEVTYSPKKSGSELSVVVDRVEPISLEDIVEVSNLVSAILDEDDPIEEAYNLDVSSLGAEKPLKLDSLKDYVGRYVNLTLKEAYKGYNEIEGTLEEIREEAILLSYRDKARTLKADIPLNNIARARLAIKF